MNKVFPDQVCREGRWWERVCLSVHAHMHACMCVRTGVGGGGVLCFGFAFGQIQTMCSNKK